jgi:hypothetical protein
MKWIKTKERLPEPLKKVIFKTERPIHAPEIMLNRNVFHGCWNGNSWCDERKMEYTYVDDVTEWLDEDAFDGRIDIKWAIIAISWLGLLSIGLLLFNDRIEILGLWFFATIVILRYNLRQLLPWNSKMFKKK